MEVTSYKEKLNREMHGSVRRSRLGLGVANWDFPSLGIIEMVCSQGQSGKQDKDNAKNNEIVQTEESVTSKLVQPSLNLQSRLSEVLGTDKLEDKNRWKLLRRSKQLLAMRTVPLELAERLDLRRKWNLHRDVTTVLDCFPALKYSYSSLRGKKFDGAVSILSNGQSARIDDVARSHSIRLDPVDSPKELYKYRQRIQRIIAWAYANELVPVMMTLTLYHRWKALDSLCRVLRGAWSDLFRGSAGLKRKEHIGLRGYVRRLEETFNDGDANFDESLNSGWHPHYHVILLVPREKLSVVSDYESELRKVWVKLVRKHYFKEFKEDVPQAFLSSFEKHGLFFSRFKSAAHAQNCGCKHGRAGDLFEVKDGKYLAKIMGTDSPLYGGDTEMTAFLMKNSKTPFELLKGEVTANLADLWCEYAIALKKVPSFKFSQGLEEEVDEFFDSSNGIALSVDDDSTEQVVVRLKPEDYRWLYRHCLIGDLLEVVKNSGAEGAKSWLKNSYNIDVVKEEVAPPALNDSLDVQELVNDVAAPFVEETSMFVGESDLVKAVDDCTFDLVDCAFAGFSSLHRYALFKPVAAAFDVGFAVTFPRVCW